MYYPTFLLCYSKTEINTGTVHNMLSDIKTLTVQYPAKLQIKAKFGLDRLPHLLV